MSTSLRGHVDVVSRDMIAGWAADASRPEMTVALRVTVNGQTAEFSGAQPRNDLKGLFQHSTGNYGFRLTTKPLPLPLFTASHVEVVFAANGKPVPGGSVTIAPLGTPVSTSARTGQITPVVITTTGRAGSSLLMARLARHPNILVGRDHPYELKLLSYYTLALNTFVAKADRERSTKPDSMLTGKSFFVGFNPFNEDRDWRDADYKSFWEESSPDILRECFVSLINAYYARVARSTDKPAAMFFAEKIATSDLARHATTFMYGTVHEIMLVRDPRDIVCSARLFWKRSFDDSIKALRVGFDKMMQPRVEAGLRQHVVRYEDLVLDPSVVMRGVFTFLNVSSDTDSINVEKENDSFQVHGTSISPEKTIGRWRYDLTPTEAALVTREFEPFMDRFGYLNV